MYQTFSLCCLLVAAAYGQNPGQLTPEYNPPFLIQTCTDSGCNYEDTAIVFDADYRRVYSVDDNSVSCRESDGGWSSTLCPDGTSCAQNCAIDGITQDEYNNQYGVSTDGSTLRLDYLKTGDFGTNVGSRTYLLGNDNNYRLFNLKNRELTITVDTSTMECGMNGALYFSQMDGDGGMARYPDQKAGAAYGTGYCDGQCPHYLTYSNGQVNLDGNSDYGICCTEMDIWEANSWASTYTTHGCSSGGYYACEGSDCGDGDDYYNGVCDKTGCEMSPLRQNNRLFYGANETYTVDTTQPLTIITQFLTDDNTDTGKLVEIRRIWRQGEDIPNPVANWGYSQDYDSITAEYCSEYKSTFGEYNDFEEAGGLQAIDAAFEAGMVMAFSMWEDPNSYMQWLDSLSPPDGDPSVPGVFRGPCPIDAGNPDDNHANYPDAYVTFSDIKVGTIGSTR